MATEYRSKIRNRVYQRKFDHEEAQRRHRNGETVAALAREYGVHANAVRRVVDPYTKRRMELHTWEWMRTHKEHHYDECPSCGGRKRTVSKECRACHNAQRMPQHIRGSKLLCTRCRRYLPIDQFPFQAKAAHRLFRHGFCRECQAKTRQAHRERRKLACRECGAPVTNPLDNMRSTRFTGLCAACWQKLESPFSVAARARKAEND